MYLTKIDKIRQELVLAKTFEDLRDIHDKAQLFEIWARQEGCGIDIENDGAEIRLLARRKMGEWLNQNIAHNGGRPKKTMTNSHGFNLKDVKVNLKQSERLQKEFEISEVICENYVEECRQKKKRITPHGLLQKNLQEFPMDSPPLPKDVFNVIYADPPWKYDNTGLVGMIEKQAHYPTMSLENICKLKIPSFKNSILFLWVTNPFLREGLQVCEAWGFNYKSNIVWIKRNLKKPGIGFYVRGQHELLFICTKGSMLPTSNIVVSSIIEADIDEHSKKPEQGYNLIEKLYPNGKYLELFARDTRKNWTSWGNEICLTEIPS